MNKNSFTYPKYNFNSSSGYFKILALESFIPGKVVTNEEIIKDLSLNINPNIIKQSVGVSQRRIADHTMSDADLMSLAAEKALAKANLQPDDLNKILVTKFFGDRMLPMTASFLHSKLKLKKAVHSYDIDGGLHSFFLALDMVAKMPLTNDQPIMISSGGICNRLVNKKDARHAFLFGDGASAIILKASEDRHVIFSYQLTNPQLSYLSQSRCFDGKLTADLFEKQGQASFYDLYSIENWADAHYFVAESTAKSMAVMEANEHIAKEDIDGIILGCFNKNMESAVLEGLDLPGKKVFSPLLNYGNTMSATLPISLWKAIGSGHFPTGSKILLASVGEGLSIGFMIYQI